MTKTHGRISRTKDPDSPAKEPKAKTANDPERAKSDQDALLGRVKKVIKKSRRRLSEEKFEKQLQRTIAFLEDLRSKLEGSNNSVIKVDKQKRKRSAKMAKPKTASKKKKPAATAVKQPPAASAESTE